MVFRVTYRQMETSPALSYCAKVKILETVSKYVPHPIEIHLKFSIQSDLCTVNCHVLAAEGFNIWVKNTDPSMYAALEGLLCKLDTRLRRHKEKLRSRNAKEIAARVRAQHDHYDPVMSDVV